MKSSLSLRAVLVIIVAAITLFPNIVVVYLLSTTGQFQLVWWFPVWLVGVIALSIGAGIAVTNTLLRPLFALRDDLQKLANRQERLASLEIDVGLEHPVEIRTLRQAFANLLEALREENQKRGAFMATLVHDLKTPIIAANHALSAIEHNDSLTRDERIVLVKSIQLENEALLSLVQKMVDANRFERDDVQLILEAGELEEVVQAVLHRISAAALERGVAVRLSGQGRALIAKKELERAVQNLLDNAIRYAKSSVEIQLEDGVITVQDDGAGLPSSLEHLAKPFNSERVAMAGREYTSGTGGLGLFIVSRIAELHGGQLEHVTTHVGTGSPTQSGAGLSIRLQKVPSDVN